MARVDKELAKKDERTLAWKTRDSLEGKGGGGEVPEVWADCRTGE